MNEVEQSIKSDINVIVYSLRIVIVNNQHTEKLNSEWAV